MIQLLGFIFKTTILIYVLLQFTACFDKLKNENLALIEPGMTERQVENILGVPEDILVGGFGARSHSYIYKKRQYGCDSKIRK